MINTFLPTFIDSGRIWLVMYFMNYLIEILSDENYAVTIQATLSMLLNDSRLLTQECASKAMTIIFHKWCGSRL